MLFSYESALREAKRMGEGYTIRKKWYGFIVVDCPVYCTSKKTCICEQGKAKDNKNVK